MNQAPAVVHAHYRIRETTRFRVWQAEGRGLSYLILRLVTYLVVMPVLWILLVSLRTQEE